MPLSSFPFMSLLSRLPQITLIVALVTFTVSLYLTITSGVGLSQPTNLLFILALALSVLSMFLAQNPNNERAALFFWASAGVWGAAAYSNFQMLGLFALIVAVGAGVSAFLIERESRIYSFVGPALFIGIAFSLVILSNLLTR